MRFNWNGLASSLHRYAKCIKHLKFVHKFVKTMSNSRCFSNIPWHGVRKEIFLCVVVAKKLHADYGEDVDDDEEHEGEVT